MILKQLGIFGWREADENLVLASLLTGDPLSLESRVSKKSLRRAWISRRPARQGAKRT